MPLYAAIVLWFLTSLVHAEPEQATAAVEKTTVTAMTEPPVGAAELANITLALFFVLALIFILAWLYRRYGNIASLNRSNMQVLGGVSLGNRERAVLLEVEGERILVGVAPGHVSKLHVFDKENAISALDDEADDQMNSAKSSLKENDSVFAEKLKEMIKPMSGEKS